MYSNLRAAIRVTTNEGKMKPVYIVTIYESIEKHDRRGNTINYTYVGVIRLKVNSFCRLKILYTQTFISNCLALTKRDIF